MGFQKRRGQSVRYERQSRTPRRSIGCTGTIRRLVGRAICTITIDVDVRALWSQIGKLFVHTPLGGPGATP